MDWKSLFTGLYSLPRLKKPFGKKGPEIVFFLEGLSASRLRDYWLVFDKPRSSFYGIMIHNHARYSTEILVPCGKQCLRV